MTLYGVATIDDVVIGDIPAIHGGGTQSLSGWAVGAADAFDALALTRVSTDHFVYGM